MKLKSLLSTLLLLLCLHLQAEIIIHKDLTGLTLHTEYGDFTVQEPVIIDLIECPAMQRLKHIHQYGVACYARNKPDFSRFDHSVGVFVLLRRFNASLEEQIAGLLHDASHTVFSHVGDTLFNRYFNQYSYQDDIHEWFLEKTGTIAILKQYYLAECCSESSKKNMRMLEQDKPDLCADRIEYLLRGGLCEGILTPEEVSFILNDLLFENGLWLCRSVESARKLGATSLWLSENIFSTSWNAFAYDHAAQALKRALELNALTLDDIHFSTDEIIWQKLRALNDSFIDQAIHKIQHWPQYYTHGNAQTYTTHYKTKLLGVNPWVKTAHGIERLSALDSTYALEYSRVEQQTKRGWYLIERE